LVKIAGVSAVAKNVARYWRDPGVAGVGLLRADFTTQEYRPHFHNEWVIAVTERGGAIVKSQGRAVEARPSALLVFNPAESQSAWMGSSRRWAYRALYLDPSTMNEVGDATGVRSVPLFRFEAIMDLELSRRFLALHRALESGCNDPLRKRELLMGLFGRLFQHHGGDAASAPGWVPADRALFGRVERVMRERYSSSDLTLAYLAETVGLTCFQLIGLFKRVVGLTPHAYLLQIRLGIACECLKRGRSIAMAASEAGFYDQSALTNHFRRSYGITPRQFASAFTSGVYYRQ
jgi:AraC-like DNA-binding protein